MKPRLFYNTEKSVWICAQLDPICSRLKFVRVYYELGTGKTPKKAWDDAFPKSWWQKIKEAFRI